MLERWHTTNWILPRNNSIPLIYNVEPYRDWQELLSFVKKKKKKKGFFLRFLILPERQSEDFLEVVEQEEIPTCFDITILPKKNVHCCCGQSHLDCDQVCDQQEITLSIDCSVGTIVEEYLCK